jgi:hypothetical protein
MNRTNLINAYLNQINQTNEYLSQSIELLSNQERTLSRLLSDTSRNTNINRSTNQFSNLFRFRPIPRNNEYLPVVNMDSFFEGFLDPVSVPPSREQIDTATETCLYREIENPQNTTCPIAIVAFQPDQEVIKILHCGHIFKKTELEQWFEFNYRCPLCRYDIRNYRPSNS